MRESNSDASTLAVPTTIDGGRVYGLQQYQADKHFSIAVDPEDSSIFYLGGALQPTNNKSDFTLVTAAVTGSLGTTIEVNSATGIAANQKLVIDLGNPNQETVEVASVTAGASAIIRGGGAAGQNMVQVFTPAGFAQNNPVIVFEPSGNLAHGTVQAVADRTNTATTLAGDVAKGVTTITLASSTNYAIGDRLMIRQGSKVETATVKAVNSVTRRSLLLRATSMDRRSAWLTAIRPAQRFEYSARSP